MKNKKYYSVLFLFFSINSYGYVDPNSLFRCPSLPFTYPSDGNGYVIVSPDAKVGDAVLVQPFGTPNLACAGTGIKAPAESGTLSIYLQARRPETIGNQVFATFNSSSAVVGIGVDGLPYTDRGWYIGDGEYYSIGGYYTLSSWDMTLLAFDWGWYKIKDLKANVMKFTQIYEFMNIIVYNGDTPLFYWTMDSPLNIGNITVRNEACTFTVPTTTRILNTAKVSDFSGVGSTVDYQDVPVPIVCKTDTSYSLTVSARNTVSSAHDVLVSANALSDGATGVGVELLYRDKSLPASYTGTYTIPSEELLLNSVLIDFSVRYYQISSTITAGNIETYFDLVVNYN